MNRRGFLKTVIGSAAALYATAIPASVLSISDNDEFWKLVEEGAYVSGRTFILDGQIVFDKEYPTPVFTNCVFKFKNIRNNEYMMYFTTKSSGVQLYGNYFENLIGTGGGFIFQHT